MDSILTSVKKLLGIAEEYDSFDIDLIMHVNSVLSILTQLGVGPSEGFMIEDEGATWSEFLQDKTTIESVKTYMYVKLKPIFDPSTSSAAMEALNRMASELEWRLQVAVDPVNSES